MKYTKISKATLFQCRKAWGDHIREEKKNMIIIVYTPMYHMVSIENEL